MSAVRATAGLSAWAIFSTCAPELIGAIFLFDGVGGLLPQGMDDVTRLPLVAQGLLDRGYSEAEVKKVLGGNMLLQELLYKR